MNVRATTLAALLAAGAVTVAAAPAGADTAPEAAYRAGVVGESVVATLEEATFALAPDARSVLVRDSAGQQVMALPLAFELDGTPHPIAHRIVDAGRTLVLTPDLGLKPVASPMENQLALNDFASNMSKGPLIGTIAGTVIGALVGAAIGLGSCLLVGPGCLATTPAAIAAFAGAGGLAGTLVAGGAALADGAWKYLTTLQAAPGASAYAQQDGLLDPNGTGVPDANLRLPSGSASGLKAGSSGGSSH
ncbi:hypothetical protein [Nocardia inohanensis]|uniref:hypothetical protein n=1 Tax=Nocardia inohanensis TaxID=209246 RepID=UPI000AEC183A|nr:hypothetical protein [Nocardia inohanensis]